MRENSKPYHHWRRYMCRGGKRTTWRPLVEYHLISPAKQQVIPRRQHKRTWGKPVLLLHLAWEMMKRRIMGNPGRAPGAMILMPLASHHIGSSPAPLFLSFQVVSGRFTVYRRRGQVGHARSTLPSMPESQIVLNLYIIG